MQDSRSSAEGATPASGTALVREESSAEHLALKRIELSARPIGILINLISIVAGLISIVVIVSVVVLALSSKSIPAELTNWGGIILGFYFGQYLSLVRDYMGVIQTGGRERS